MSPLPLKADLRHVTYALSDALDLVGVDDVDHGKRVGIMALECGKAAGFPEAEATFLFDLGMLHDLGVSSTTVHQRLMAQFEWEDAQVHCEVGSALLEGFPPLAALALPVKLHHRRWEQLVEEGVDPLVARRANLICLADRVDALSKPYRRSGTLPMHVEEIRDQIRQRAGGFFSPEGVELFLEVSRAEAFWLRLEPRAIQTFIQDLLAMEAPFEASMEDLRRLAEIFSRIVDAKSPFTAEHSLGVAGLARLLAEQLGLGEESRAKIEIAGLLHDVGKLRIPDEILDKPGALDPQERGVIRAHSFETYQILHHIKGFEEVTPWAAYHHEEPGGRGYPFHVDGRALPVEARLLRVADIFQAMVQDRPYRKGWSRDQVLRFLDTLVAEDRVDAEGVALAAACGEDAMAAARAGAGASGSVPLRHV